VSQQAKYLGHS